MAPSSDPRDALDTNARRSTWSPRRRGAVRRMTLKHVLGDISGHPYRSIFDGVSCEVGVSGGGLDLGVAEELGDHRQALAQRQRA